jgi:hypothetical protein
MTVVNIDLRRLSSKGCIWTLFLMLTSPPQPLPILTVVPLQTLQRYYGEDREGWRCGDALWEVPAGWESLKSLAPNSRERLMKLWCPWARECDQGPNLGSPLQGVVAEHSTPYPSAARPDSDLWRKRKMKIVIDSRYNRLHHSSPSKMNTGTISVDRTRLSSAIGSSSATPARAVIAATRLHLRRKPISAGIEKSPVKCWTPINGAIRRRHLEMTSFIRR